MKWYIMITCIIYIQYDSLEVIWRMGLVKIQFTIPWIKKNKSYVEQKSTVSTIIIS